MQRPPAALSLSPAEGAALIERLAQHTLRAADRCVLVQVVRWLLWLVFVVQEAKRSLKRLRTVLCGKGAHVSQSRAPEAASPSHELVGEGAGAGAVRAMAEEASGGEAAEAQPGASDAASPPKPAGGHRPGTGRLGAEAYAGAERVECRHEDLRVGEVCPVCGQGRLYALPPGVEIRLDGHALLSAIRYAVEQLRCSACGQVCTASLPMDAGPEKYSPRARAVLAVSRYSVGLPFYRVEGYQAMLGVPVPDATPWEQIEKVGDSSSVVLEYLERLAAQGELISQDDTAVRILTLLKENQALQAQAEALGFSRSKERTGMCTTA